MVRQRNHIGWLVAVFIVVAIIWPVSKWMINVATRSESVTGKMAARTKAKTSILDAPCCPRCRSNDFMPLIITISDPDVSPDHFGYYHGIRVRFSRKGLLTGDDMYCASCGYKWGGDWTNYFDKPTLLRLGFTERELEKPRSGPRKRNE